SVRETAPQWSPDGKWIAFIGDKDGREEVWVCDERGEQLRQLSKGDSEKRDIVWSPDSKALLFAASDKKLYKYSFDTSQTTVLASGEVMGFGGSAIASPQWSPDGKWVSYTKASATLLPHVFVLP